MDNNTDIQELLSSNRAILAHYAGKSHKLELSTKLILGAFCYFAVLTAACITLWTIIGDWPREIVEALSRPFAMVLSIGIGGCYYKEKRV